MNRRRFHPSNRRPKAIPSETGSSSLSQEIFEQCEKLKQTVLSLPNGKPQIWLARQDLLDQYGQLILSDLDYALEKKIEHDLWTVVFKNEITYKQEQLKENAQHPTKRTEIQTSLQTLYEYARGYYMKLIQDVVHAYHFENAICKLTLPFLHKRSQTSVEHRSCKEASMLYFLQHILVHVGDLNRYSNQIDLAKTFYQYAIYTIPCLGQPYNQIAILHEMKNPLSLLTSGQNHLITAYYYVRSIAIKVTFPLAISNLEKLFQRLKDLPITRYEQPQNDVLTLFLQITAMINLEANLDSLPLFTNLFQTILIKNFSQTHVIQMITILMFTLHRTLGLLPRSSSSKQPDLQFDLTLQVLLLIIEQCLQAIQMPLSLMIIDEQHILPILYLSSAYLANILRFKSNLFEHQVFKEKQTMWSALAKLLRSFGVYATSLEIGKDKNKPSESLFVTYADYPLTEERTLECFTPLNDVLKGYNFKKYDDNEMTNEHLSEKDERQLRKLRLVSIIRNLCLKSDEKNKKKLFDHLITYVKDDVVCFESSAPIIPQIPSSSFGVPGDRRTVQKSTTEEQRVNTVNGASTKTPRGTRNIALRQFLEPVPAGPEPTPNDSFVNKKTPLNGTMAFPLPSPHLLNHPSNGQSEMWPHLSISNESRNVFQQQQSSDYESRSASVWSNNEDSKDQSPHELLAPGLMFSQPSTNTNYKQPSK